MLERILTQQVFFYFVGAAIGTGILAKLISGISLKRLVKAASNMGKSNHALMKLVRAKFEHACMVSDKVQNVRAFVDKYVYEYKVLGLRFHSWQQLEKVTIWLCGIISLAGAALAYSVNGAGILMLRSIIVGSSGMIVLLLLRITWDEEYQLKMIKTYMVDFLENTYAHRYVKKNRKEFQVTVEPAPSVEEQDTEEKDTKEKISALGRGFRKKKEKAEAVPVSASVYEEDDDYRSQKNFRSDYEQYGMQGMRREYIPEPEKARKVQSAENETVETSRQDLEKEAKIREILEEFLA